GDPGREGGGPGRRVPRRRHDDRRRGRRPLHRQGPRRVGDAGPPDGRRPDDLRPAAPRLNQGGATTPFADAIVVAAGTSSRMGGIDKLGVLLGGRPILAHALEAIAAAPDVRRIVIVTSEDRIEAVATAGWLPAAVDLAVCGRARRP